MQYAVDVYHGACLKKQKQPTVIFGMLFALGNEPCTLEIKLRYITCEAWLRRYATSR